MVLDGFEAQFVGDGAHVFAGGGLLGGGARDGGELDEVFPELYGLETGENWGHFVLRGAAVGMHFDEDNDLHSTYIVQGKNRREAGHE